jgi:uncharacterized protein
MDELTRCASADDPDAVEMSNDSSNRHFSDVFASRFGRRDILKGGIGLAVSSVLAGPAMAYENPPAFGPGGKGGQVKLGFEAVPVNRLDAVTVPPGYLAEPFIPWGTPITGSYPAYIDGGLNTGEDQEQQVGMHHDGMHYFPMARGVAGNEHGLLCLNHEYIDQPKMHPNGATVVGGVRTVADEVRKEIAAHGVSVVEIRKDARGRWQVVRGKYNRRVTAATPMEITGPARAHPKLRTKYSPGGTRTRGTINNCAHGYTPWGTYLTCEENWAGYFVNRGTQPREHSRYGVATGAGRYRWETVPDSFADDRYKRFDATAQAGVSAEQDYRNEPNGQGWVVEIDPWDPKSTPKKRTALGRFAHEGAWIAPPRAGRPIVYYMGDDAQNEYIYKFVTREAYNPARSSGDMLDRGTLYVARFNDDGSGDWLALDFEDPAFIAAANAAGVMFDSQADVLINTRLAADVVGATKMDRPEWGSVHPRTGEVYMTLTNNSSRPAGSVNQSNPRGPNPYGHIIRWREAGGRHEARAFQWDLFALAGPANDSAVFDAAGNVKALDDNNIFASPDGLWIDQFGLIWIQTDMSGSQLASGPFGNNAMLAADPETGDVRRFFVGPPGSEVTGVVSTPDGKTLFVNIQHPGETGVSTWPTGGRGRSATVIVTRDDGGIVGT